MDEIAIHAIRARGRHGANPGERDAEQVFDIDVILDVNLQDAARSDDLADTSDYAAIHARVVAIVAATSFGLLERLADEILAEIFADARIVRARVQIAKPHLLDGATPSVTLARDNPRARTAS